MWWVKECNTFNLWFQYLFNSKKGRRNETRKEGRKIEKERKGGRMEKKRKCNLLFIVARKVWCGRA